VIFAIGKKWKELIKNLQTILKKQYGLEKNSEAKYNVLVWLDELEMTLFEIQEYGSTRYLSATDRVYIVLNNTIVIGRMYGNYSKETHNFDIDRIDILPGHRGKGWCKKLLHEFIKNMEQKYGKRKRNPLSFSLENVGGVGGCRCYAKSFSSQSYIVKRKKSPMTIDECEEFSNQRLSRDQKLMVFQKKQQQNLVFRRQMK